MSGKWDVIGRKPKNVVRWPVEAVIEEGVDRPGGPPEGCRILMGEEDFLLAKSLKKLFGKLRSSHHGSDFEIGTGDWEPLAAYRI